MNQLKLRKNLEQFLSYFFVGGIAALVEWAGFYTFNSLIGIGYLAATALSFVVATTVNWVLGRLFTFKKEAARKNKFADAFGVFAVSGVGLGFNMLLMYLFVGLLKFWPLFAKVLSTGIVFLWNYLARKFFVYQNKG